MTSTILRSLNALAAAIERTCAAGESCGRRLWPTLHWLWDAIDWRDVAEIVLTGLVITAAGSWLLLRWSHRTLIALSERLGQQFSAVLEGKPDAWPAPSIAATIDTCAADPASRDAEIVRPPAVETPTKANKAAASSHRRQRRSRRRGHTPPSSQARQLRPVSSRPSLRP